MLPFSCFSTIGCPEKTLPEVLALADSQSIPFIEVRTLEGREDMPQYLQQTFGTPAAVEACLARFRARPLVWGTSFSLIGHDTLEGIESLFPWIAPYRWIRVFDGGEFGRPVTPEEMERCGRCLEHTREQLHAAGIAAQILVETHGSLATPPECRRFIDFLDGKLAILWDTHHTWRHGHSSTSGTWNRIGPWVRHIHIKDSQTDPASKEGYRYSLPTEGEFNLAELLSLLKRDGYAGQVSLEWEKRWHPELPELDSAFASYLQRY